MLLLRLCLLSSTIWASSSKHGKKQGDHRRDSPPLPSSHKSSTEPGFFVGDFLGETAAMKNLFASKGAMSSVSKVRALVACDLPGTQCDLTLYEDLQDVSFIITTRPFDVPQMSLVDGVPVPQSVTIRSDSVTSIDMDSGSSYTWSITQSALGVEDWEAEITFDWAEDTVSVDIALSDSRLLLLEDKIICQRQLISGNNNSESAKNMQAICELNRDPITDQLEELKIFFGKNNGPVALLYLNPDAESLRRLQVKRSGHMLITKIDNAEKYFGDQLLWAPAVPALTIHLVEIDAPKGSQQASHSEYPKPKKNKKNASQSSRGTGSGSPKVNRGVLNDDAFALLDARAQKTHRYIYLKVTVAGRRVFAFEGNVSRAEPIILDSAEQVSAAETSTPDLNDEAIQNHEYNTLFNSTVGRGTLKGRNFFAGYKVAAGNDKYIGISIQPNGSNLSIDYDDPSRPDGTIEVSSARCLYTMDAISGRFYISLDPRTSPKAVSKKALSKSPAELFYAKVGTETLKHVSVRLQYVFNLNAILAQFTLVKASGEAILHQPIYVCRNIGAIKALEKIRPSSDLEEID